MQENRINCLIPSFGIETNEGSSRVENLIIPLTSKSLHGLGIVLFAFSSTSSLRIITESSPVHRESVGTISTFISSFLVLVFYIFIAMNGYWTFLDLTEDNILLSFQRRCHSKVFYYFVQCVVLLSVVCSWPINGAICVYTLNRMSKDFLSLVNLYPSSSSSSNKLTTCNLY